MTFTLTIVGFVVALFAIVMIHELGHYLMARAYGFRVLEYFLGFGPRLWSFHRGEIEYGVKAVPAGGYVKIAGMNPFENDVPPGDEHRAYGAKPRWQRAFVILAGPMSHFIVGGLILGLVVAIWGNAIGPWRVDQVPQYVGASYSPAYVVGMRPGDLILSIGGVPTTDTDSLSGAVSNHIGEPIPVVVDRGGQTLTFTVVPVTDVVDGETKGRLGVVVTAIGRERHAFPIAMLDGFRQAGDAIVNSVSQIGHVFGPHGVSRVFSLLFTDTPREQTDPASVIGISRQFGTIGAQRDWAGLLIGFAYVVIFIGLINLLPLPPFDGGHLAVLAIERLKGRTVDLKKMVPVSAVVLAFVAFFMISALLLDIWKPVPISP